MYVHPCIYAAVHFPIMQNTFIGQSAPLTVEAVVSLHFSRRFMIRMSDPDCQRVPSFTGNLTLPNQSQPDRMMIGSEESVRAVFYVCVLSRVLSFGFPAL